MKKYLLMISFLLGALYVSSQDLDNIRKMIILQQFDKAKPEIDAFTADAKNAGKAEGWYYKAFIYYSLGKVASKPIPESQALYQTALDAIKKYAELDPKMPLTTEEKNGTIYNLYYGFYDLGIKAYNTKNFQQSYDLFKRSMDVHDYIYGKSLKGFNDFKLPALDTDVVWNLAFLANELKKKDEASVYYAKIADANLADEKYALAYDELVLKYKREKNPDLFYKYLASAKKLYPVDKPYWDAQEIEFAIKDLEGKALLDKYEELTQKMPDNYMVFYNYAVEIDRFNGTAEAKPADVGTNRKKMGELFKKAIAIKPTIEANLQMANLLYSNSFDLQEQIDKIKGKAAPDLKLKNDLMTQRKAMMTESIPYAEAAVKQLAVLPEYKFADKTNYKLALDILINVNKVLGNAAKTAEWEKEKARVDKL